MYKGKSTRNWSLLPPEVVRLVTTHSLLNASARGSLPHVWTKSDKWQGRMVFTVVRDIEIIQKLMNVCPAWAAALEFHLWWQQAAAALDPLDHTLPFARAQHLSPYRHFRQNLIQRTCIPCRVNYSASASGLLEARKLVYTHTLGYIACCKDHKKDRFCGICLRDTSHEDALLAENEECEIWPKVETTCRACRAERLWKVSMEGEIQPESRLTKEAEAIGGRSMTSDDWEARQAIDSFIEFGEGSIREIILLSMEKLWLRKNTKIAEMMRLALATSRMQSRMVENANAAGIPGTGTGEYESEEEVSELGDDEDTELMSITEESQGVRELAINDWARHRILDGLWHSPADQWYNIQKDSQANWLPSSSRLPSLTYVSATHPVPWSLSQTASESEHPDPGVSKEPPPPSLPLCSIAHDAFRKQLRAVLLPAMVNVVRRIVMECAVDGSDACIRVSRMGLDDVVHSLRDGGVWFNGMDWAQKRREDMRDESDESSSSDRSSSGATSPVLSTSTLQTTPSPPPVSDEKSSASRSDDSMSFKSSSPPTSRKHVSLLSTSPLTLPIAISPVLELPTQIPSIPYIPDRLSDFKSFTTDSIICVWREAIAPLFQCRCNICDRAVLKANIAAGNIIPSQRPPIVNDSKEPIQHCPPVEIRLDDRSNEDVECSPNRPITINNQRNPAPSPNRKRSCEAAEITDEVDTPTNLAATDERNARSKTPPEKRQKVEELKNNLTVGVL